MIERIAFLKGDQVQEISLCDPADAEAWCHVRGFDAWLIQDITPGAPLRELAAGDRCQAPATPARDRGLEASKATAVRVSVEYVRGGVVDPVKLAQARALVPEPIDPK